jgi:hypothetical protein
MIRIHKRVHSHDILLLYALVLSTVAMVKNRNAYHNICILFVDLLKYARRKVVNPKSDSVLCNL